METDKIKRLLEAYFDATADAAQEAELRRLLADTQPGDLPTDMAADARLARTLLGMPAPDMAMPAGFAASLGKQVDALDRSRRMRRRRLGWGVAAGLAVAASLMLLLMPTGGVQRIIAPAGQAPVMARTEAVQKPAQTHPEAANITSLAEKHIAQAAPSGKVKGKAKRQAAEPEAVEKHGRTVEYVDGMVLVTEYYDPAEAARLQAQAQAPIPVDAPIYVSCDGMGQSYESIEEAPEAIAMIEEAFGLIAGSRREMSGSINESEKIVTKSISEINDNR